MKKTALIAALATLSVCAGTVYAADIEAGRTKSASCMGCHGADGNSPAPMNPNLAGQKEQYLVTTMLDYKNGKRQHSVMQAMLAPLSEDQIRDIAAFYAAQTCQ
jgi:cytochrome c553